jgi:hypothetical protein
MAHSPFYICSMRSVKIIWFTLLLTLWDPEYTRLTVKFILFKIFKSLAKKLAFVIRIVFVYYCRFYLSPLIFDRSIFDSVSKRFLIVFSSLTISCSLMKTSLVSPKFSNIRKSKGLLSLMLCPSTFNHNNWKHKIEQNIARVFIRHLTTENIFGKM